jgi:hypothetical protein
MSWLTYEMSGCNPLNVLLSSDKVRALIARCHETVLIAVPSRTTVSTSKFAHEKPSTTTPGELLSLPTTESRRPTSYPKNSSQQLERQYNLLTSTPQSQRRAGGTDTTQMATSISSGASKIQTRHTTPVSLLYLHQIHPTMQFSAKKMRSSVVYSRPKPGDDNCKSMARIFAPKLSFQHHGVFLHTGVQTSCINLVLRSALLLAFGVLALLTRHASLLRSHDFSNIDSLGQLQIPTMKPFF